MSEDLNVIVPGSLRMAAPVRALDVTALPSGIPREREQTWRRWLDRSPAVAPAREMYTRYWEYAWVKAPLWVASAGHGLISADEPIAPYRASFGQGINGVVFSDTSLRRWWRMLVRHRQGLGARPICVLGLAEEQGGTIVVCGGEAMIQALDEDLAETVEVLQPGRLIVLTNAQLTNVDKSVRPCLISAGKAQLARLGGRPGVLRYLLEHSPRADLEAYRETLRAEESRNPQTSTKPRELGRMSA